MQFAKWLILVSCGGVTGQTVAEPVSIPSVADACDHVCYYQHDSDASYDSGTEPVFDPQPQPPDGVDPWGQPIGCMIPPCQGPRAQ